MYKQIAFAFSFLVATIFAYGMEERRETKISESEEISAKLITIIKETQRLPESQWFDHAANCIKESIGPKLIKQTDNNSAISSLVNFSRALNGRGYRFCQHVMNTLKTERNKHLAEQGNTNDTIKKDLIYIILGTLEQRYDESHVEQTLLERYSLFHQQDVKTTLDAFCPTGIDHALRDKGMVLKYVSSWLNYGAIVEPKHIDLVEKNIQKLKAGDLLEPLYYNGHAVNSITAWEKILGLLQQYKAKQEQQPQK